MSDSVPTYERATAYDVSVWPPEIECPDSMTWKLAVEYRGRGLWAITRGSRTCMNTSGGWDWERIPSERDDDWLATHRFPLDAALALGRREAPHVTLNDMTALEVLERHRQRHPNGRCDSE